MNRNFRLSDRVCTAMVTGYVRNESEAESFRHYAHDVLPKHLASTISAQHTRFSESDWHVTARLEVIVLTMDELHMMIADEANRLGLKPYTTCVFGGNGNEI